MVDIVQFIVVAAYLLWCLCASLSGALTREQDEHDVNIYQSDKNAHIG